MTSTVYVIDDDPGIQEVLDWLLSSVGLQVRPFSNAQDFIGVIKSDISKGLQSGCILLDVRMPVMSGLELQQVLLENSITIPVIFITGHGDVPMAVNALKLGAFDFVQKPFNNQQLLDTVLKAIRVSEEILARETRLREKQRKLSVLTVRESDVYSLLVMGYSNKAISKELAVGTKTIETHRANIIKKLHVRDLSELMAIELTDKTEPALTV